ncbi:MAG: hypothetical protein IH828_03965 [Nitrospinae bacterium]|nr:hypothetical protein [Nitrospinota bacterium]
MNTKDSRSNSLAQVGLFPRLLGQRGNVIVLVTVLLAVLLAFAGLVIDLGHLFVVRSTLHNAADAASLAAVSSLTYGPDEVRKQAQLLAQQHNVGGTPVALVLADIELGTWEIGTKEFTVLAPAEEANADSVRVTAQRSKDRNDPISLFFMRIFGHETSDVRVMAVSYRMGPCGGGIIGQKKVTLNSSSTTDSYNSELGPYSPATAGQNGDVCSCGDIELNSVSVVKGDARPGPDKTVILNDSSYVTGSTNPGGCPVLDDIEFGDIATNNDNGNIPAVTDGGKDPFEMGPYDLALSSGDSITLPGGRYYFTSVELSNGASLQVDGPTVIYLTGTFSVSNSNIINPGQNPENLIIMASSNEDVQLNHNVDFYGVLYAPNAHVVNGSTVDFYGAVMGEEVSLNSSGAVHYDESLYELALLKNVGIDVATVRPVLVQ